jgi:hypothetical protein
MNTLKSSRNCWCLCTRTILQLELVSAYGANDSGNRNAGRTEMAKKVVKQRDWTKEDVRTLKTLAREKTKTTVIARKLKRSVGATYQKARALGVTLGGGRKKRGA